MRERGKDPARGEPPPDVRILLNRVQVCVDARTTLAHLFEEELVQVNEAVHADPRRLLDLRDGRAIRCPRCGHVSYNPNDVAQHYCGACHQFHDFMERVVADPEDPEPAELCRYCRNPTEGILLFPTDARGRAIDTIPVCTWCFGDVTGHRLTPADPTDAVYGLVQGYPFGVRKECPR